MRDEQLPEKRAVGQTAESRRNPAAAADHRAGAHAFYLALGYDEKRKRFLKLLE